MQFTDIVFAVFMTAVFIIYWLILRGRTRAQNVLILASSYLFYGWWDPRFLGLIILTTCSTYFTALYGRGRYGKVFTTANILLNVGILIIFKYLNFFSENIGRLFNLFGLNLDWFTIDVLLPVGISFYTFQAIAYSIDVYKGRIEACRDPLPFFTFIAYFPQLVAGPIERASYLLPQISNPRKWRFDEAVEGLRMILFGLVKKLCIADMLSLYVELIFDNPSPSPIQVVEGGILFSLEIYCDFSAYCEIARGVSQLLGIKLSVNFKFPYFSRNILEFWQRWHISLMEWFRDYIYIPLGGNRKGVTRTVLNTYAVFLLSGLWHGAAWNFIAWGVYWSIIYVAAKFILGQKRPTGKISFKNLPQIILTFGVASFGFYIFRCNTFSQITEGFGLGLLLYAGLFLILWLLSMIIVRIKWSLRFVFFALTATLCAFLYFTITHPLPVLRYWWIIPTLLVSVIEWRTKNLQFPMEEVPARKWQRESLYIFFFLCIVISEPIDMTFIYFQF